MIVPKRWRMPEAHGMQAESLAAALHIGPLAARVLVHRGFDDPDRARRFLSPTLAELHDPYLLAGMHDAVERLRRAIESQEKILLYGDYDADGTSSVVILKKAIELAGGKADFHVPHRLKDGYGMRAEVIEEAARNGVGLVISVDTGIRAAEVVRGARELGIDVIITDHHLPEAEVPPALAVLNPNRADCSYPDKNLCGAGVAFKLVQALIGTLDWPAEKKSRIVESFLKLVAIATVADVVPLTGENRIIVKRGIEGMGTVRNPGLRALLSAAGFEDGETPSAGQIAFRIAPRINAAGRMANARDVVDLFLTADAQQAALLAGQLQQLNQDRQQAEAEVVRSILEECERQPVGDNQAALVFAGDGWHRGVVGIAASRLVERFCRPVFVLSADGLGGELQGSGRSVRAFHLLEALESMPELFTRFGGHRQAAGLTLKAGQLEEFRERLGAYAGTRLTAEDFRPELEFDAVIGLGEITERSANEVLSLAPFGFGNPAPLFAALNVEVAGEPRVFAEKHANMPLRQNGRTVVAKAWNFAARLDEVRRGAKIDAALTIEDDPVSKRRGYPGWSVVLRDLRVSD